MIRFCSSGTSAAPISTPRSPRATMTASASREDVVEHRDRLRLLDLRDHVRRRAGRLDQRLQRLDVRGRSGRTRARRSRRRARARTGGRRCPSASATGSAARRPGRLTPLCELTVPPTITSQSARPRSTSPHPQPDGAVVDQDVEAGLEHRAEHGGAIGRSPSCGASSPAIVTSVAALELDAARRARRPGASAPAGRRSARPARPTSSCTARIAPCALGVILVRAVREVEPGAVDRRASAASSTVGHARRRGRSWRRSSCGVGRQPCR